MRQRSVQAAMEGGEPVRAGHPEPTLRRSRRSVGAARWRAVAALAAGSPAWLFASVARAQPAVEAPPAAAEAQPPTEKGPGDAAAPPPAAAPEAGPPSAPPVPGEPSAGEPPAGERPNGDAPAAGAAPAGAPPAGAAAETAADPSAAGAAAAGPTAAAPQTPAEPPPSPTATAPNTAPRLERDELASAGYVPGYRQYVGLGMSPYAPRTPGMAGGTTASYGAPLPFQGWTFKWSGYMTASLQFSIDERPDPSDGQSSTVFHTPPATIDNYGVFASTATVPGNWVGMSFYYGNARVSATVSVDTWNPTQPTTYYSVGSQYFINNAFMTYTPEALGKLKLRFQVGRFSTNYGGLSRYGSGIYTNALAGGPRGVGELTRAELPVGGTFTLIAEHGFMGTRDGTAPSEVVRGPMNGWRRPLWPGAFMHHAHLGFVAKGKFQTTVQTHYMTNWSQEDRNGALVDDPQTHAVDEANLRDGRLTVWGGDVTIAHDAFGFLGFGAAYVVGHDAYPLKGLNTYGGEGEQIVDRWWGLPSGGNGNLLIGAVNYSVSIGKLVNYPGTFAGDGPDIMVSTGLHVAKIGSDYAAYDGIVRHKYGADVLYTFLRYMGAGLRVDRVAPNSEDSGETFHVVAPRLVFRSDYNSHEQVQLIYGKWFYGDRTRNEGTGLRTPERLDDQMVALNFNMWW